MRNLDQTQTIDDLRTMARRRLPEFLFVPMDQGDGCGTGPKRNVAAFDQYLFNARTMIATDSDGLRTPLFGRTYSLPFGISALGYAGKLRRYADESLAEAAAEANIPFILSGASCATIETIARLAPNHVWQQIYAARKSEITERFVTRAADAGVRVLVMTVDSPVHQRNHWLARTGIALPATIRRSAWPYVLWQAVTHPSWSLEVVRNGGLPGLESWREFALQPPTAAASVRAFHDNMPGRQDWCEVDRVRQWWPGQLVIKGLVDPSDAKRALALGADAVTVSNHGGNKLERMAAALDYLPGIAGALPSDASVFFDGGIRSGMDVMVTRALGATFSFLGRAALYGVVAGGTEGALRAIAIIREDLERTLALIGAGSVARVDSTFIRHSSGSAPKSPTRDS